jgi:hypothetical protein
MILKPKHLYRVSIPRSLMKKKYALIIPTYIIDTNNATEGMFKCIACIDIANNFSIDGWLYFSFGDKCIFENRTVGDFMEMSYRIKKRGYRFRCDFKSGEIEKLNRRRNA